METNQERIITIGRFAYSRALLLQSLLHDTGIESFLVHKGIVMPPNYTDIRVKESDAKKAIILINESMKDSGTAKEQSLQSMMALRRILVPVDFSATSFNACKFACSLANKFKAEVKLLHVYFNPIIEVQPYSDFYDYQKKLSDSLKEIQEVAVENLEKLKNNLEEYCTEKGYTHTSISTKFLAGLGVDEILYYSEKFKPFIIVMGTHGLTANAVHTFGKISDGVVRNSKVPVLALPANSSDNIDDVKSVMYAMDYDKSDYTAINRLIQMLSPIGISIKCVHFSFSRSKPWDAVKLEEFKSHFHEEYKDVDISFENIVTGNIINGIETFIRNNSIDALAAVTHKRTFIEKYINPSFSEKLFKSIKKPFFVFHAK